MVGVSVVSATHPLPNLLSFASPADAHVMRWDVIEDHRVIIIGTTYGLFQSTGPVLPLIRARTPFTGALHLVPPKTIMLSTLTDVPMFAHGGPQFR
ncbi:UNVERIFIED_CONTAM: hypothetical protein K2H54_029601 [Gekko kuhli]